MNRNELVEAVAARVGDKRTAATTVEAVLDIVTRTVADGEKVALSGFGVFEKVDRPARTARNPATGAAVEVAATSVPRFRAGQGFKTTVRGASAPSAAATGEQRRSSASSAEEDGGKAKAGGKAKDGGKAKAEGKAGGKAKAGSGKGGSSGGAREAKGKDDGKKGKAKTGKK